MKLSALKKRDKFSIAAAASVLSAIAVPAAGGTIAYTYDPLGRVISATYPNGACTTYTYDAVGNRAQYTSGSTSAPTAKTVAVTDYQDVSTSVDPRLNNPGCGALTLQSVGPASHGTTSIAGGGAAILYTPASGYLGSDSFTYTLANVAGQATGSVNVTISPPTLSPVANTGQINSRHLNITAPVTPAGSVAVASITNSPYGYPLSVSYTQASSGKVSYDGTYLTYIYNTTVNYNLFTSDSFTYTVSDGHGHSSAGTVNVNIIVTTTQ
jgi:YD repeat-containing protein